MRIAFVAPESDPILKVGGLADVVGSLPRELRKLGHDVEIYIPHFGAMRHGHLGELTDEGAVTVLQEPLPASARVLGATVRGVPVHLIDCPELFEREPHPYGSYDDTPARYGFFALAVLEAMSRDGWTPDAIHLHDWTTGLLPVYRSLRYKNGPLGKAGILFTIHNVAHPGSCSAAWMRALGLPYDLFRWDQLEFQGTLSFLKGGILWSTMVSTVSPTYAKEIQWPPLGCGMDGVLRFRTRDLVGIVNGIDPEVWNPAKPADRDRGLWASYAVDAMEGKEVNRAMLRQELGLADEPAMPLFGFISRLDHQKGVSALLEAMPQFLAGGTQLAVLGDGADHYRNELKRLADRFPGHVAGGLEFNPVLAERIYAASDFFLMPSKFEPCGLAQMIAARYGSVPVVARTGGLADTIVDADENRDGNGFVFPTPVSMNDQEWTPMASASLADAIRRAWGAWSDRARYEALRRRAMLTDFSWRRSAERYVEVYEEAARRERAG
ncbi:MAG: glycogen synthase [Planctomycetes bacterium]|nr:glycogen synthase [Planctomycetota bacterium]